MNRGKRYCLLVLGWACACLALIAAFNGTTDPYSILETPEVDGLNARKTEIFFHLGTTKTYQFYRSNASSLILGSSRAGRAIDPRHPSLAGQYFYNFATPGVLPGQDLLKLRSAIATRPIKRVIYCVDFFTFNSFYTMPTSYTEEFRKRLALNSSFWTSTVFLQQALLDYAASLWSYNTLRDSISTIRNQTAAESGTLQYTVLNAGGTWGVILESNRRLLQAFRLSENSYLRQIWFPPESPRFSLVSSDVSPNMAFADFEALLSLAHANSIDMTIVILPVHARLLEALSYAGLWENFEYWKKQLVIINERVATSGGYSPFDLWDFNGYYPLITEPVSNDINAKELRWFYDSGHASVNTGNLILDILDGQRVENFGGKINVHNIDDWLRKQRYLREAYRIADPSTATSIRMTVDKTRAQYPWKISPVPESELVVDKFANPEHPH